MMMEEGGESAGGVIKSVRWTLPPSEANDNGGGVKTTVASLTLTSEDRRLFMKDEEHDRRERRSYDYPSLFNDLDSGDDQKHQEWCLLEQLEELHRRANAVRTEQERVWAQIAKNHQA